MDAATIAQSTLFAERFVLVRDMPDGEQIEFARYIDFAEGWKAGTRQVTTIDREGAYSLWEILPSGNTRRRAKFCHHRLMLRQVNRNKGGLIATLAAS